MRIASSAGARSTTVPAFMPCATRVAEAEHLDRMAAAAQRFVLRVRLQPRDQAGDLAGADVERGDERRAPRRQRLHSGRQAVRERAHASPPLALRRRSFMARSRACAAASESRTMTRSGQPQIDRGDVARQNAACRGRARRARRARRSASSSGKRTSMPFLSRRFQRRSAIRTGAHGFVAHCRIAVEQGQKFLARALRRRRRPRAAAGVAHALAHERLEHRAVVGDDAESCRPSARARTARARSIAISSRSG